MSAQTQPHPNIPASFLSLAENKSGSSVPETDRGFRVKESFENSCCDPFKHLGQFLPNMIQIYFIVDAQKDLVQKI